MWDLPRPGLEPVSPALAGRFSTTAPPGKPPIHSWNFSRCLTLCHWNVTAPVKKDHLVPRSKIYVRFDHYSLLRVELFSSSWGETCKKEKQGHLRKPVVETTKERGKIHISDVKHVGVSPGVFLRACKLLADSLGTFWSVTMPRTSCYAVIGYWRNSRWRD